MPAPFATAELDGSPHRSVAEDGHADLIAPVFKRDGRVAALSVRGVRSAGD